MPTLFLSIVIPAYNEEARILPTLRRVRAYLAAQGYAWEIIVANDGSNDATPRLVREFALTHPEVTLLDLPHRGKGGAVKAGMLHATGDNRFLCDADLSMPIEQLDRFLPPKVEGYDVVIGSREAPGARRINEPGRRHLMGRAFNRMARLFLVRRIRDTQCGFKLFSAEAAGTLFPLQRTDGFGFDIEVLYLAQRLGMRLVETPIDWYYMSQSKVRPVQDSLLMARDILRVRWRALRGDYGRLSPARYRQAKGKEDP